MSLSVVTYQMIKGPILMGGNRDEDEEDEVITKSPVKVRPKRPKLFKVLLHNDDYTTMEFVIFILQRFSLDLTL